MYYKSDVTFVCTLLLCKNERNLSLHEITSVFQSVAVRGAFNRFPDFFVQAFRIVIDS